MRKNISLHEDIYKFTSEITKKHFTEPPISAENFPFKYRLRRNTTDTKNF